MTKWGCSFGGCYLAGQALSLHCSHGANSLSVCPVLMHDLCQLTDYCCSQSLAAQLLFCCKLTTS